MCPKYFRLSAVIVAVIIVTLAMATSAMAWKKWMSRVDPGKKKPPAAPWVPLPPAPNYAVGQPVWIAMDNCYVIPPLIKHWHWEMKIPQGADVRVLFAHGYYGVGPQGSATVLVASTAVLKPPFWIKSWHFATFPQPDWEVIKLERTAKGEPDSIAMEIIDMDSECQWPPEVEDQHVIMERIRHGAPYDTIRLTEVWIFHESSPVDTAITPTILAPPGSGTWSYEFVYVDQDGNPLPQGAVRWYTDGNGIEVEQEYDIAFTMAGVVDGLYTLCIYDAEEGEYKRFVIPIGVVDIPTLTEWGLIIFGVVLLGFITYVFLRRRRKAVVSYQ
jgi:hypothetical protein